MLPSSTARERIGGVESKRLSLALRERVFSSEALRFGAAHFCFLVAPRFP